MGARFKFSTVIVTYIAGVERELEVEVSGVAHGAVPAFTPRGEYGPIDPPEAAFCEFDPIVIRSTVTEYGKPKPVELTLPEWLLSERQIECLTEEAFESTDAYAETF